VALRDMTRDLAALIDPGAPAMGALMGRLRETIGAADAELLDAGLRRVAAHVAPRPVRVIFGGHFSSGKSSLINLLIGTQLLPTSDYPETGVPCLLLSGEADQVLVRTGRGEKKIPFSTEAIANYVSLTGPDGAYRDSVRAVKEVRVTLGKRPIPAEAAWVDSPGINDVKLEDLVRELARTADILVWVVNSSQEFAVTEQKFVAAHIAEAGPASVVFILNVRLDSDTIPAWEKFNARRDRYLRRITDNVDAGGVPARVVCTSARAAAAAAPSGFGAWEARALLAAVSDPADPRVAATRIFRAAAELRDVMEKLDARVAAEEQRVAAENAKAAALAKERARQDDEFRRAVRQEISSLLAGYSGPIDNCAARVTRKLMKGSTPKEARFYKSQFDSKLRAATKRAAPRAVRVINKCARAHGRGPLDDRGKEQIARLLKPKWSSIPGYTKSGSDIFEKFGEWWNSSKNQREAIKSQLRQAASAAAADLLGATERIAAEASERCPPDNAHRAPAQADQSRLKALRAANLTLEQSVAEPLRRALSAAQAQAGG
jgi:predicted GTPase